MQFTNFTKIPDTYPGIHKNVKNPSYNPYLKIAFFGVFAKMHFNFTVVFYLTIKKLILYKEKKVNTI